jgi:hypothetical protein
LPAPTKSELLFEQWCGQHGLRLRRIKEAHRDIHKRPDYAVAVPQGRAWCIVEIKEIEPTAADLDLLEQLKQGKPAVRWAKPGARVRRRIGRASDQLRKFSKRGFPTIALLVDNTASFHVEDLHIAAAMAGEPTLVVEINKPVQEASVVVKSAGGATMTSTQNTSVSAVGVLRQLSETELVIDLYHNPHARVPLSPEAVAPFLRKQSPFDVANMGPSIFDVLKDRKEMQEWMDDPEGKLDRTIKEVLAELRDERAS